MIEDADPDEMIVDPDTRTLLVHWTNGHRSEYTFDLLRRICPCAECTEKRNAAESSGGEEHGGGKATLRMVPSGAARPGRVDILNVLPVGRYGVNIRFSDGHAFGIFSFDMLREVCPCSGCSDKAAS